MPSVWLWRCGHCGWEPMTKGLELHCGSCGRREDGYATYYIATNKASHCYRESTDLIGFQSNSIIGSHATSYPPETIGGHTGSEGYRAVIREQTTRYNVSAPSPVYQPFTYGPPQWWWCCQCKDGPKSTSHQPRCVICQHNACSYCTRK